MPQMTKPERKVACYSEYDPLAKVILCSPEHMQIREVINWTQRRFVEDNENIDTQRAVEQHHTFRQTLQKNGAQVITLPAKKYPEQVFTRDIGFVLQNTLFIARMDREIRRGEEQILKDWLRAREIPFEQITGGSIEGGDVVIDRDTVWVGNSDRTSSSATYELQRKLPDLNIVSVPLDPKYLHLDCVFNVISEDEALIFPAAFAEGDIQRFASRYELIEVSEEEQFTLGTNILSIGANKVISLPINQGVNEQLRKRGYTVIEVDISEIIKSGGSFRCITMPLVRE